jgi:hypothetical protein
MNGTADIKAYINRYFSDELQYDETPAGAMERNQLRKWMLYWANEETNTKLKKEFLKPSKTNKFPGLF